MTLAITHAALRRQTRDERVCEALVARYPQHLIDRGLRRNRWLQRWRKLCAAGGATDRKRRKLIGRLLPNAYIEPYTCADDAREAIAESRREQAVMHKAARASARRTKTACQRINEHSRAKRAMLLAATGTEDKHPQPRIVPVQTGFEGVSKPSRSGFDSYCPVDSGELEDLFDDTPAFDFVEAADDGSVEDLFIDGPADSEADEGLEELL